jgi:hypothetical protein
MWMCVRNERARRRHALAEAIRKPRGAGCVGIGLASEPALITPPPCVPVDGEKDSSSNGVGWPPALEDPSAPPLAGVVEQHRRALSPEAVANIVYHATFFGLLGGFREQQRRETRVERREEQGREGLSLKQNGPVKGGCVPHRSFRDGRRRGQPNRSCSCARAADLMAHTNAPMG